MERSEEREENQETPSAQLVFLTPHSSLLPLLTSRCFSRLTPALPHSSLLPLLTSRCCLLLTPAVAHFSLYLTSRRFLLLDFSGRA